MTVQSTQLLHLAEETSDMAQEGGLSKDETDDIWDARYNKIKNLLDPTEPGDAVNLNYITKNQNSLLNQLNNTGASQNSSIMATGDAQNARLTATGNNQNTRLTSTGDTQNKRLTDTGDSYVATMTTLKNTATDKAAEATNQAALAQKWAEAEDSPNGEYGSKSSLGWAMEAKASANKAAASASASQSSANASSASATQSANSASASKSSANASASSASAASSSASAASTSAGNAKTSETNAANSAKAAKQSEENAKTWDPTNYTKTLKIIKPDNDGHNVLTLLEEIPDYYSYNYHRCGGSFSIYPYVRSGINPHLKFPPVQCAISLPYNINTNDGYVGWSTNDSYVPIVIKNNNTNKVYWGLSMRGNGHTVKMFGAFEHNISVIDTLLSASDKDVYDGYTILHKADVITPAKASDIPTKTSQLINDSGFVTKGDGDSTIINLIDTFYPIGTVYMSADKSKTKADFPFMRYGAWEEVPANLCVQTGAASEAGTQREAGLPNITGSFNLMGVQDTEGNTYSGAIYRSGLVQSWGKGHTPGEQPTVALDASRSSSIYGTSDTVQPPAYIVRAWVRTA